MSNDNRASCGCPTYWVEDKGKPYGDCPYCEIDRLLKEIKELREDSKDCITCAKKSAERVDELEKYNRQLSRQRDAICWRLENVWDVGAEVTGDLMSWEWVDQSEECYESIKSRAETAELEVERLNTYIKQTAPRVEVDE